MRAAAVAAAMMALGTSCAPVTVSETRVYGRSDVLTIDGEVIGVLAEMRGIANEALVIDYARCIAAGHALSTGANFARHLRTSVTETGGVWTADALYTVSRAIPAGLARIDAEVTVADCAERGVPSA